MNSQFEANQISRDSFLVSEHFISMANQATQDVVRMLSVLGQAHSTGSRLSLNSLDHQSLKLAILRITWGSLKKKMAASRTPHQT